MKKNNKFRGGTSNAFSLNYKFDSVSPAGKCNGTALDLIKRYNDLAKEAHSAGDFVEMEVFRQYAEHYRKIVTEINERRGYKVEAPAQVENVPQADNSDTPTAAAPESAPVAPVETPVEPVKKSFKVIELSSAVAAESEVLSKPKRAPRRRILNKEASV